MPSSSYADMYLCLTYKHLKPKVTTQQVVDCIKPYLDRKGYSRLLMVEEHGKDGNNDHLNVYVTFDRPDTQTNVKNAVYTHVYDKLVEDYQRTKNDVHVRKLNDKQMADNYVGKEKNYRVVLDENWNFNPEVWYGTKTQLEREIERLRPSVQLFTKYEGLLRNMLIDEAVKAGRVKCHTHPIVKGFVAGCPLCDVKKTEDPHMWDKINSMTFNLPWN